MTDTIETDFSVEEKKVLEELETKHKRITPFRIKGVGLVVVRRPLRSEWRRYKQELEKPMIDKVVAKENCFRNLVCYPNAEAFDAVLDEYPGMMDLFEACVDNLATGEKSEIAVLGKDWKTPG